MSRSPTTAVMASLWPPCFPRRGLSPNPSLFACVLRDFALVVISTGSDTPCFPIWPRPSPRVQPMFFMSLSATSLYTPSIGSSTVALRFRLSGTRSTTVFHWFNSVRIVSHRPRPTLAWSPSTCSLALMYCSISGSVYGWPSSFTVSFTVLSCMTSRHILMVWRFGRLNKLLHQRGIARAAFLLIMPGRSSTSLRHLMLCSACFQNLGIFASNPVSLMFSSFSGVVHNTTPLPSSKRPPHQWSRISFHTPRDSSRYSSIFLAWRPFRCEDHDRTPAPASILRVAY